ncbi:hypothetical protein RclHR1_05600002 [Rhizophagus clarus]|uniref:Uncharacterized protein n=1 Tax=Rhizophagus clarus TaxID=94130 RepID=A0A2Z6S6K6_9GLOM|nr:hypothetical protein RclHR1_05600002 [Rhizophagus clarus]
MERFWEMIQLVNNSISNEYHTAKHIKQKPLYKTCTICHPSHCLPEDFKQLHRLLDPEPEEDMHYELFEELYAMAVSPKQPDDDTENDHDKADDQDMEDDNENEWDEPEDSDNENEESENNKDKLEEEKSREEEKEKEFICEIFSRIFVNDS